MKIGTRPLHPGLAIRPNLLQWLDKPRAGFVATDARAAKAWQPKARRVFLDCLGPAPQPVPPRPRVFERKQLDGYSRVMFTIDTAPRLKALCWLCLPDGFSNSRGRKSPAMIATPGHGIGAKDLLAMDKLGTPRKEGEGYQKDYALQAVRLGYPALVVEPMGFGERRDADHMSGKSGESPCQAAAVLASMLGTSLARIRLNDLQRAMDHLDTIPAIDAGRVGLMGISGGGQMTLWTSAADTRIKLAVVSGYLNSFRHSVMGMYHCICNFAPGLAREFDMTDLAAMVAPRPILIESGTKDPIFPIQATRAAIKRVRAIYSVYGAADRVESDIFTGDHQWSGRKLEGFLRKWL
jgi:dienelactone hydrolase